VGRLGGRYKMGLVWGLEFGIGVWVSFVYGMERLLIVFLLWVCMLLYKQLCVSSAAYSVCAPLCW
jgi:hypothetical protein